MKNKYTLPMFYLGLVALIFAGCSRSGSVSNEVAQSPSKSVKIGAILPLTGPSAWLGEQELIGLEAAATRYSSAEGIKIEIKVDDTASQSARAVTIAQRLIEVDRVDVLFVTTSSAYKAVAPIADRAQVPLLVMASEPGLIDEHPTSFRIYMNFGDEAVTMAEYIRRRNVKTVAIIRMNLEAFAGSSVKLRASLGTASNVLVEEAYEVGARDFRSSIERVASAKPDLVVLFPLGGEFIPLIEQVRQQPLLAHTPVLAGYTVTGPPALQNGFSIFQGVSFTAFPVGRDTPAIRSVFADKRTRSGLPLSDFMDYAYAYDSVSFLVEGLRNRTAGQPLLETMRNISRFQGITGTYSVSKREISVPMRVAQYQGGVLTYLP